MAISKVTSASITTNAVGPTQLNEASNYDFTGTVTGAGGNMSPSFYAIRTGGSQNLSDNTWTKAQINTELYDTNSAYDNSSNYRFTPQTAGKYYIYSSASLSDTGLQYENNLKIYKNGSAISTDEQQYFYDTGGANLATHFLAVVCDMNGSSDYVEAYMKADSNGGTPKISNGSSFGAYKIIE